MRDCVLIPIYNESKTIGSVVQLLKKKNCDVLIIDDGSTDRSGELAKARGAIVIRHEQRNGKGYSLRQGFRYILEQGYDGVITMDGDGQHDIEDLNAFLEIKRCQHADIVNGNRLVDPKGMPLIRRWTNHFMSFLISGVCKQKIPDTQCGFRYINRVVLENIDLTCNDFEIESEILIKACKNGYKVSSVPIKTIYMNEESNIRPLKDTFRFFSYLLKELCTPVKKRIG